MRVSMTSISPYQVVDVIKLISEPEKLGHWELETTVWGFWVQWSWAGPLALGSLLEDSRN